MKECKVNIYSSRCCELGTKGCEVQHDIKLIIAAVNLLHRKEQEGFDDMHNFLCKGVLVDRGKYDWNYVWFWGLNRWGKVWPKIEYRISERNRRGDVLPSNS